MKTANNATWIADSAVPDNSKIECTLYELVQAVDDELGIGNDDLVVFVVLDILKSRNAKWVNRPPIPVNFAYPSDLIFRAA